MRLRDSDDDRVTAAEDRSTEGPRETAGDAGVEPPPEQSPEEYVESVGDRLENDDPAAADAVGDLLEIARDNRDGLRVAAGEALDAIGRADPTGLEVWSDDLAAAASSTDDEVAFFGLRGLAQLAAETPRAASKGIEAALGNLEAPTADLRQAALSVVAEVGPDDPDAVRRADRPLARALHDGDPAVRTAAAIAAGRLLGEDPAPFPRAATALLDSVDDEDDRVREFALLALANFAREHPSNVPQKPRAITALSGVSDEELGLRRGATGEAVSALVSLTFGEDAATT